MRAWSLTVLVVTAALALGACRSGAVEITYGPAPGTRVEYRVEVDTLTVWDLDEDTALDAGPVSEPDRQELVVRQEVLAADESGVRVDVTIERPDAVPRRFVVRFDRAARLTRVERADGIPTSTLDDLGLAELFPAAAGAPPDAPLEPGSSWKVDDELLLPGSAEPVALQGRGRLVQLDVRGGEDVAVVRTELSFPVRTVAAAPSGQVRLDGDQQVSQRSVHRLADGTLESSDTVTVGDYDVLVEPPPGRTADPVPGTLHIEVRTRTTRLG